MADFNHVYMGSLVKRAQHKDSDAFAELYALTYKHIYQYACHYLKNTDTAQDAVQDIYILALKNIDNIKDVTLFVAWLNQIAFHVCYDICKKIISNTEKLLQSFWMFFQMNTRPIIRNIIY